MIAVELSLKQLMDAVRQLSPSEKLELNEMIWKEYIPVPLEHQEIVKERIRNCKENPEQLLDWDAASTHLHS
jgi:hypothetical protein